MANVPPLLIAPDNTKKGTAEAGWALYFALLLRRSTSL
jgi:hypothetical protein